MTPWQSILKTNFTKWEDLALFLEWDTPFPTYVSSHFPLNLPRRLAEKIEKNNFQDPLLRQFLPSPLEKVDDLVALGQRDPVGDGPSQCTPRLLHKYKGRALLLCTSACAMHCRYCFRQHYPYDTQSTDFGPELTYLRNDTSLSEIILSGGDPLSLPHRRLQALIQALDTIPHLKRLRFHTRFPMGIPERIDAAFLELLANSRLQTFFVIHSNHPREWDDTIRSALKKVGQLGIPLLCQTVLLKGINDDFDVLKTLAEELLDQGILPYYLHQLDPVAGGMHFQVDPGKGHQLIAELQAHLPGYGVPRYVQEIAGEPSKTPTSARNRSGTPLFLGGSDL